MINSITRQSDVPVTQQITRALLNHPCIIKSPVHYQIICAVLNHLCSIKSPVHY